MSICSAHFVPKADCPACQVDLMDDPIWRLKVAQAEAAGTHKCKCGFEYYKTVDSCPQCNSPREPFLKQTLRKVVDLFNK